MRKVLEAQHREEEAQVDFIGHIVWAKPSPPRCSVRGTTTLRCLSNYNLGCDSLSPTCRRHPLPPVPSLSRKMPVLDERPRSPRSSPKSRSSDRFAYIRLPMCRRISSKCLHPGAGMQKLRKMKVTAAAALFAGFAIAGPVELAERQHCLAVSKNRPRCMLWGNIYHP